MKSVNTANTSDFVNAHLLAYKHVKISVNKWILETTHPQKPLTIFGFDQVSLHTYSVTLLLNERIDFSLDEWVSEVTHPIDVWLKFGSNFNGIPLLYF